MAGIGVKQTLATATIGGMRVAGFGCDFNRSMQHLSSKFRAEDVVDEAEIEDLLHRDRQVIDVGSLAERRFTAYHSASF